MENQQLHELHEAHVRSFRAKMPGAPESNPPLSELQSTVVCRCRPLLPDHDNGSFQAVTTNGPNIYVHKEVSKAGLVDTTGKINSKKFQLHASTSDGDDQSIFDLFVQPVVEKSTAGGIGCVLAYGQTGAGKTHTIEAMMEIMFKNGIEIVAVSCFEIRNDKVHDLLNEGEELRVLTGAEGTDNIVGLKKVETVGGEIEITEVVGRAKSLRSTASTNANDQSSRSHAFYTFFLPSGGSLTFVDLAGSENKADAISHSESENADERLKEMKEINKSLGDLKECIRLTLVNSKGGKQQHIPYRRSVLTRLLRTSLDVSPTSEVKTTFLCHVAPTRRSLPMTINSLNYAEQMVSATNAAREAAKFKGPEKWSPKMVASWVEKLDGGKYAKLAESMHMSGKIFQTMWLNDFIKRVCAAGGSEVDGNYIYEKFHDLVAESKKKKKVKKVEEVTIEIVEGKKTWPKPDAAVMYGAGLSAACVENS
mmetsp:Transcript_18249/g.33918  ORF Transcript_18249/g.33918 Transcript_18249/m.33918 type:complete len:479 (-) Transcript_18249:88-1524(-)|eukprot:CAMPEP_0182503102 /NCGR_PEP_ID=MMETSP1321-20130603/14681_1 /TAXON_ID=91990 /ORGANISM="Bolidomonas sp., Strain RCC1657" /LENGTH=478 /DNA_ID=CAMNT_0024708201 /DNA_START=106 /DNA_END=1542 /DNA_ORIENTATION=-